LEQVLLMTMTGLAMLSWVSPWWAVAGIAAVGLPVLAHLLSRTRYREVMFPATRLVRQAVESTTRIERPRHLLLMLLRWLVLLLVVLAFMRPIWMPQAEAVDEQQGVSLIILIDRSASMHRTDNGATLYGRALREAAALVDGLDPSRDVASVVLVGGASEALLPEPTAQMQLLISRLEATEPGYAAADWASANAVAQRMAEQRRMPTQLIVISDQQGDRPDLNLAMPSRYGRPTEYLRIDGPSDNTSLRLIGLSPYPPIAGRPVTAQLELRNFGDESRDVTLNTTFGDTTAQYHTTLRPGATESLELSLPTPPPGQALLQIAIDEPDALAYDDAAGLPMLIQDQTRAMVLYPDDDSEQGLLAARVGLMLSPGEVEGWATPVIDTMGFTTAAQHLVDRDTALLRTVIVLRPERVDAELAEALYSYMERGGGVVAFVGQVDSQTNDRPLIVPLLPDGSADEPATVSASAIDFDRPALRVFEGPARGGLANLQWPGVDHAIALPQSTPILNSVDGRAIVVSNNPVFGLGRLIAINADLTPCPGGLLAEPAFIVLFNELCDYASPGPMMPSPANPGDPLPQDLLNSARLSTPDNTDAQADTYTVPGPYLTLNAEGELTGGTWAALDPRESDTQRGPDWSINAGSNGNDNDNNDGADNTARDADGQAGEQTGAAIAASIRPTPVELWPYFVLGAVVIAGCESLLLWRFASGQGGGR